MSKAEKMFKKLDWEKTRDDEIGLEYELGNYLTLYFKKDGSKWWTITNHNRDTTKITPQLHQAITQQMKELGWV